MDDFFDMIKNAQTSNSLVTEACMKNYQQQLNNIFNAINKPDQTYSSPSNPPTYLFHPHLQSSFLRDGGDRATNFSPEAPSFPFLQNNGVFSGSQRGRNSQPPSFSSTLLGDGVFSGSQGNRASQAPGFSSLLGDDIFRGSQTARDAQAPSFSSLLGDGVFSGSQTTRDSSPSPKLLPDRGGNIVAGTTNNSARPYSPKYLLGLIRESYSNIRASFMFPGIQFNTRQLECLVNDLLQPVMEDTLPRLEALNPDTFARFSALLKEFLYLIKCLEVVVRRCSDSQRWWINAFTLADGGINFSFFYYELVKCIALVDITYIQFRNPNQEGLGDLIKFTLQDEEAVIQSVVCKSGETDLRALDTRKVQVMCEDIIYNESHNTFDFQKEKLPLANILSAKLAHRREDSLDVQRASSFTIQDYMWISPQHLVWERPLGQGAYGTVHEVKWLENRFAGKLFQTSDNGSFKQEAAILSRLQHSSIVQLWGCCIDQQLNTCTLILDLMDKDLCAFLENRASAAPPGSQPLSYVVSVGIMLQIAEGMRYLHSQGVIHRDLKAQNVLVLLHPLHLFAEEGFVSVKVCDFGMAKTKLASSNFTSPHLGTPYWRAPEVFKDEAQEKKYTKKADVYSFAMTCAQILTAKPPFDDIPLIHLYRKITAEGMRPSLPSSCPRYLAAYLQRCWATDANLRPPFSEICRMLRHLKGLLLRSGSEDDCMFLCITEVDLEEMARHLGVKWCVDESLKSRKVSRDVIVRFLHKASINEHFASNPNFPRALIVMGDYLANMRGSKHDYKQAIELFQIGARLRFAEAQWKLGLFLELGLGAEKDEEEAVRLYLEEAAEQDHANAYVELGRCFDYGRGVQLSDKMASFYWARALKHQIATDKPLHCVSELIEITIHGSDQDLCEVAAIRLWELSIRSRVGREILAGPNCINIKALITALADPQTVDISKHTITLMLPNFAMEPEMGRVMEEAGGIGALVNFFGTRGIQNHRWRTGILTAFEKLFSAKEGGGGARCEAAVKSGIIPSLLDCLRHDPRAASVLLMQCLEAEDAAKAWLSKRKDIVMAIFRIKPTTHPGVSSLHAAHMKKQLSSLGFDYIY